MNKKLLFLVLTLVSSSGSVFGMEQSLTTELQEQCKGALRFFYKRWPLAFNEIIAASCERKNREILTFAVSHVSQYGADNWITHEKIVGEHGLTYDYVEHDCIREDVAQIIKDLVVIVGNHVELKF